MVAAAVVAERKRTVESESVFEGMLAFELADGWVVQGGDGLQVGERVLGIRKKIVYCEHKKTSSIMLF